jgi:glyoxylase-like metal-dependent hydrolase (beta-lactamase superfamily II)
VTTLLDGAATVPNPHGIFGMNQPLEDVESALAAAQLPTDQMEFTFFPVLVNTGAELVLFDTGNGTGAQPGRGNLVDVMAEAGYSPDQVDVVVLTHLHGDHIGGLMTNGAPTFPNARYVTGSAEYNFWSSEDRIGTGQERGHQAVMGMLAPLAEQTSFVDPGFSVASGIEALNAFGHTPGHMVYHIESEGARLMIMADTANHFELSLARPDWEVRFDIDKAAAARTRKSLFGMIASDGIPFIGYHMPFPAMGFGETAGDGFRYVPATYQLNV